MSASVPPTPLALNEAAINAIAAAVADRIAGTSAVRELVSSRELAARLGRTPAWVRSHATELGAVRVGEGSKPRLFFDLGDVLERVASSSVLRAAEETKASSKRKPRTPPLAAMGTGGELLPVRGSAAGRPVRRKDPDQKETP